MIYAHNVQWQDAGRPRNEGHLGQQPEGFKDWLPLNQHARSIQVPSADKSLFPRIRARAIGGCHPNKIYPNQKIG
jgi:hypothetical protein